MRILIGLMALAGLGFLAYEELFKATPAPNKSLGKNFAAIGTVANAFQGKPAAPTKATFGKPVTPTSSADFGSGGDAGAGGDFGNPTPGDFGSGAINSSNVASSGSDF